MIIPNTQQNILLLYINLTILKFFLDIKIQKQQLNSIKTLTNTINIIVLNNPITFHFNQFLDNTLKQIIDYILTFTIILLIQNKSHDKTKHILLNQFISTTISTITTNITHHKKNHLPTLYQQLFLLINKFPKNLPKFHLTLTIIIAHQHLHDTPIPINENLSTFHRQIHHTTNHIISTHNDNKHRRYFNQLLKKLKIYQKKLHI